MSGSPCRGLAASLLACWLAAGCASLSVPEKLARVGLVLMSESEARVPDSERGRYLPCRVLPAHSAPALPEHPAGYLIVGVDRRRAPDAEAILKALADWSPGEPLNLWVRRNPYAFPDAEWWEGDVLLKYR